MTITITAFAESLDQGGGYARDMIVRWALEEVGQPYAVRAVAWADFKKPEHRQRNPFGQIPTYEEGDLSTFQIVVAGREVDGDVAIMMVEGGGSEKAWSY